MVDSGWQPLHEPLSFQARCLSMPVFSCHFCESLFSPECALIFCRAEATLCASRQSVLVPFRPLVSKSRHFQRAAIIPLGSFVQSSVNNLFGFEGLETETPIEPLGNQVSSASAT